MFYTKNPKHLTVFSPDTVNIQFLTVNTSNYKQATLNTKSHSHPFTVEKPINECNRVLPQPRSQGSLLPVPTERERVGKRTWERG